jgi:hypothetical protein
MYAIFITNQGPAIQITFPKGKSENAKFYKGTVFHELNKNFKNRQPATGLRGDRLNMTMFRHTKQPSYENIRNRKRLPPYSPDIASSDIFLFPRLKNTLLQENIKHEKTIGSAIFQYLNSIPQKHYENAFKN